MISEEDMNKARREVDDVFKRMREGVKFKPMEINLDKQGAKWSEPLRGAADYKLMWVRLRDEIRQLQVKITPDDALLNLNPVSSSLICLRLTLVVILNMMDFIEEVYDAGTNDKPE